MTETLLHETVKVEKHGTITRLTIAHPPANAISSAVIAGLRQALDEAIEQDCRAVVITGDGDRFFAAGADVTEFATNGEETIGSGLGITREIELARMPVIAAINGICFGGGCEIALACDIRIASTTAKLGQPEIKLGIIPGWGGTQRLPRLIGRGPATHLLLSGEPIDAQRALALGLVSEVVEPADLAAKAMAVAEMIAGQAPLAVAATKRAIVEGLERPLREALEIEHGEFSRVFNSADAREGVTAFLEKRSPKWTGN